MKLGDVKANRKVKPFFEDDKIKIVTEEVNNKITAFQCTAKYKNKEAKFPVSGYKILAAWKKAEEFFKDLV